MGTTSTNNLTNTDLAFEQMLTNANAASLEDANQAQARVWSTLTKQSNDDKKSWLSYYLAPLALLGVVAVVFAGSLRLTNLTNPSLTQVNTAINELDKSIQELSGFSTELNNLDNGIISW